MLQKFLAGKITFLDTLLSEFVYNRIKSNYTQAVIEPKLREQYEKLVND